MASFPLVETVSVDVLERDVNRPLPKLETIPGAQIHILSAGQPGHWRELLPRERWRSARRCLTRGHEAYFASVDGELAAWIAFTRKSFRHPLIGLHVRLAPGEVYAYGMKAEEPYRHLGVGAAVVAAMLSGLQAESAAERVYGWVDKTNLKSQALLRVVFGFRQVQTVRRVMILGRFGGQIPRSDQPSFGPLSRVGRHSEVRRP